MEEFRLELIALMKRHGVELFGFDQYDGNEDFCGVDYYFAKDGDLKSELISIEQLKIDQHMTD